jgi:leucyl aminopeptidase
MRVEVATAPPEDVEADVLAAPVVFPARPLAGSAADVDQRLRGLLGRLVEEGEVTGEVRSAPLVHLNGEIRAHRLAPAGVGELEHFDADALRSAAAAVAQAADELAETLAWLVDESLPLPPDEQAKAIVDGTLLGAYDPGRWKSDGRPRRLRKLVVCASNGGVAQAAVRAARVATWTNRARDLVNSPPNEATPERLAARAEEIASTVEHVTTEALDREEIEARGMGAFAAVARASHNPPRLVVMRYDPPAPSRPDLRLGLVGKAITFDTGGISLKPALRMEDMKGDMAGGAAVQEAIGAIGELELPVRVLGVVAACENMPGGGAYRPGDILTAMNGKTIEVVNTDAEGRLVLADALWYARTEGATHLLDLATLTGAMELALGDLYAGVFANDDDWRDLVVEAGRASGDHAWPWPLHRRYRRYVESVYADMKNSSDLKQGSPALAAEFLKEFVGEGPWAHIDMSGPAFLERSRGDYLTQRGGTGYGVRLIVELATRLS